MFWTHFLLQLLSSSNPSYPIASSGSILATVLTEKNAPNKANKTINTVIIKIKYIFKANGTVLSNTIAVPIVSTKPMATPMTDKINVWLTTDVAMYFVEIPWAFITPNMLDFCTVNTYMKIPITTAAIIIKKIIIKPNVNTWAVYPGISSIYSEIVDSSKSSLSNSTLSKSSSRIIKALTRPSSESSIASNRTSWYVEIVVYSTGATFTFALSVKPTTSTCSSFPARFKTSPISIPNSSWILISATT